MSKSTGEKNLQQLLRTMQPSLLEGTWAFVTVPKGRATPPGLSPLMSINIVSAYHRDSLFVPTARADEALEVLRTLAKAS